MDSPKHSQSSFTSKSAPLPPLPTTSRSSNEHDARYSQFKINTQSGIVMEGYLLKKKRKKMQGMARRFFRLDYNGELAFILDCLSTPWTHGSAMSMRLPVLLLAGALSYSFAPDSPIRDSLSVPISYISAKRKQRTLDIDGGNTVYHCKALSVRQLRAFAQGDPTR